MPNAKEEGNAKTKIKVQHLEGGIVILLGILILIFSFQIPMNPAPLLSDTAKVIKMMTEAKALPVVLGLAIMILGFIIATSKTEGPAYLSSVQSVLKANYKSLITLLGTFIYVFFIGRIHFYAATFLYLFGLMSFYKFREFKSSPQTVIKIILIAVVATVITAYVIPTGLSMPIPRG